MATPSSAKPATSRPVTAPDLKAMPRPSARLTVEACAVRTLARTETSMPMKPAAPDRIAPTAKPIACSQPSSRPTSTKIATPAMPIVVYCRVK